MRCRRFIAVTGLHHGYALRREIADHRAGALNRQTSPCSVQATVEAGNQAGRGIPTFGPAPARGVDRVQLVATGEVIRIRATPILIDARSTTGGIKLEMANLTRLDSLTKQPLNTTPSQSSVMGSSAPRSTDIDIDRAHPVITVDFAQRCIQQ